MRPTHSIVSLDQLHTRGAHSQGSFIPDRLHAFGMGRTAAGLSAGRTPVRRAFRSPVFWHAITLEIPANMVESCSSGHATPQFGTSLSCALRSPARAQLELRLDLKERNALTKEGLYSSSPNLSLLPPWKNSQVLGSVRILLSPRVWDYFLHDSEEAVRINDNSTHQSTGNPHPMGSRNSTSADEGEDDEDGEEEEAHTIVGSKPRILRFVRRLEVPFEVSRGLSSFSGRKLVS
ncbi:unnamed protein product [Echinostoma caproni]|uniref:Protein-serine/threonine phosphatase n=1 Tax=Echinostoma caproni TaxID=27848 RepID=A0A183AV05_9TREM|nr:unnamed protein product [Echinostoma caproni]